MKKIILAIAMGLFLISLVSPLDSQLFQGCGGDLETIIGCLGDAELFFFGFDIINPGISIIYPTNDLVIKDVVTGLYGLNVNFSVSDVNLYSCEYRLSGVQNISNTSIPCSNGYNNFLITITSFGDLTLDIVVKDFSNNENSSQVNFSISKYTGPQTGGGSTLDPSGRGVADFNLYNKTIMCKVVNEFLELREKNYTQSHKESLKNSLAIIFGFAVSDSVLDEYLENFEENCPEYFVIPDEPGEVIDEDNKYLGFWIVMGSILLMIISALFILQNKNKTNEVSQKWVDNFRKKLKNPKSIELFDKIFQRPKKS